MKILYFTQFYSPENIAAAFRATDHARLWATSGHSVTVFTGWPNYPAGRLFDGFDMVELGECAIDGVRVFRSASKIVQNTSFKKRIEAGVSYITHGLRNLGSNTPVGSDYDVVLVTCGTVFSAWLGVHFAKSNKLPLVVEFRDLTYKQMVATGSSERSLKVRAMRALELSFCKAADSIVVLTKGFKADLASQGIDPTKISIVPNGADLVPCEHNWHRRLRFGYFGTMGLSQDVPTTLEYAGELAKKRLAASYLLIGEGASRTIVEDAIASAPKGFLKLMHGMSMNELEKYYANIDMTVVSLQKSESFSGTIPSKIFQSFARGVPVLYIGPVGDASRLIEESGAGIVLSGSRDEDLLALEEFAAQPDLAEKLSKMSASAIDFMERNYTRKRMADQMLVSLANAAKNH